MKQSVRPIKAVIFDFDGTLADSFPVFVRAVERVLNREPFTPEEIEDMRQHSGREVIKILKIKKWKLPLLVAKGIREIDRHQNDITIFPSIPEALRNLREQGYKLYIVSSHSGRGIKLFLEQHQLEKEFDHIYSKVGLFSKSKVLRKLQRQFGYDGEECVFVGDEARDVDAAAKAGVRCIAVSWGFNTATALRAHNPTAIVDKPTLLVDAVQNLSVGPKTN